MGKGAGSSSSDNVAGVLAKSSEPAAVNANSEHNHSHNSGAIHSSGRRSKGYRKAISPPSTCHASISGYSNHPPPLNDLKTPLLNSHSVAFDDAAAAASNPNGILVSGKAPCSALPVAHGKSPQRHGDKMASRRLLLLLWPLALASFSATAVLDMLFPFFTYVKEGSGGLAQPGALPWLMFYTRLFSDLAGRSLPRVQALKTESSYCLLLIAAGVAAVSAGFLVYLKAPWQQDFVPLGLVAVGWTAGKFAPVCFCQPAFAGPAHKAAHPGF